MARPRKQGVRYPGGKLIPEKQGAPGAEIQRLMRLARRRAVHPVFGTPLGILRLEERLSDIHIEAANIYAQRRRAYDAAQGVGHRTPQSPSNGATPGRPAMSQDRASRALEAFERLYAGVMARLGFDVGRDAIAVMDRVVVNFEAPAWSEVNGLKAGLYAVAEELGLSGKPGPRRRDMRGAGAGYKSALSYPRLDNESKITSNTTET